MAMQILFKIRDTKTGLYSLGGRPPQWNKEGKVWKKVGQLASHLSMFRIHGTSGYAIPGTWEVVHLAAEEVAAQPIAEFIRGRQVMFSDGNIKPVGNKADERQGVLYE